jgi:hypothetical protein
LQNDLNYTLQRPTKKNNRLRVFTISLNIYEKNFSDIGNYRGSGLLCQKNFTGIPIRFLRLTLLAEPAPAKAGVVGVLNVFVIRLRCLLLAAALSFESEWYEQKS